MTFRAPQHTVSGVAVMQEVQSRVYRTVIEAEALSRRCMADDGCQHHHQPGWVSCQLAQMRQHAPVITIAQPWLRIACLR